MDNKVSEMIQSVDWDSISPHEWATKIPNLLLLLLSHERSSSNREQILEKLREYITHQGEIYETTVHTIPILFAILQTTSSENITWVLEILNNVRFREEQVSSFQTQTLSQFLSNISLLKEYLHDDLKQNRILSAELISRLSHSSNSVGHTLFAQLQIENDVEVKAKLIILLGKVLSNKKISDTELIGNVLNYFYSQIKTDDKLMCFYTSSSINIKRIATTETDIALLLNSIQILETDVVSNQREIDVIITSLLSVVEPLRLTILLLILSYAKSFELAVSIVQRLMALYGFRKKTYHQPLLSKFSPVQLIVAKAVRDCEYFWLSNQQKIFKHTYLISMDREELAKQIETASN